VVLIPALPLIGLILMSLGLVWLCLIIGRLKWLGLALIGAGCLTPLAVRPPDILASGDGKLVAMLGTDGDYRFSSMRAGKIAAETWLRRNAQEKRLPFPLVPLPLIELGSHQARINAMRAPAAKPVDAAANGICTKDWCRFDTRMGYVAVALTEAGAAPACATSRLVISLEPVEGSCRAADYVIDFFDLWRHGAHAIWIDGDGSFDVRRATDVGERPWKLRRFATPAQPGATQAIAEEGISTGASGQSDDPGS
jgi:competence protein ComEC